MYKKSRKKQKISHIILHFVIFFLLGWMLTGYTGRAGASGNEIQYLIWGLHTILLCIFCRFLMYIKTRKRQQKFSYHSSFCLLTDIFTFLEIRGEYRLLCLFNRQTCWIKQQKIYQLKQRYAISSCYLSHFVYFSLCFFFSLLSSYRCSFIPQNFVSLPSFFSFPQKNTQILSVGCLKLRQSHL